jgi:hypothetical protein
MIHQFRVSLSGLSQAGLKIVSHDHAILLIAKEDNSVTFMS